MTNCGTICPRRLGMPIDMDGCILPDGHEGRHVFISEWKRITWETDYDCNCPDCVNSESFADNCVLYTVDAALAEVGK